MPDWLKAFFKFLASIIIVSAAGLILFHFNFKNTVPVYTGQKDLNNLNSRVEVFRDDYGIPYISAEDENDAAFALGYVHAQERLFQMDIMRRAGEGRLSEIFGSKTLQFDIMFKTVGLDRISKQTTKQLDAKLLKLLQSYSDGVNEFIKGESENLPIEFDMLQYEPYSWKPEHCIMISKLLAWELNLSWWTDLAFSNLVQKLGEEKAKEILPDYPENAPTIIPSSIKNLSSIPLGIIEVDQSFRKFIPFNGTHIGSNNWVVNSNMSLSGKPIIANDPHLGLEAPGLWYIAVINSREWNCAGVTFPGVPAIVVGKNNFISWVITNVMTDDSDFYIENIDESGNKYMLDGWYKDLSVSTYKIKVKDSLDYKLRVKETHRGPLISDIHLLNKKYPVKLKNKINLSMRWVGRETTKEFSSYYKLNRAKDWKDFQDAIADYSVPGQNFVYADREGNIGYICGAKIPIRSTVSPTFVYDGSTEANDWKGFVPFDEIPKLFNPPENFIASANNKTVSDFPYHISNLWEPPSRIERIRQLINSKPKHSVKDFKNYQMDVVSPYAKGLTHYIVNAFNDVKIKDKNLNLSLELFKKWDYKFNKDSQVPLIYSVTFNKLLRNIFYDEMGENLFDQYIFMINVPYRTVLRLLEENNSSWFDNIKTKEVENSDEIIRQSLSDALTYLENYYGEDVADWQWGMAHKVTMKHLFYGEFPALDEKMSVGPFEIGGDGTTICNSEYSLNEPYDNFLGPSMRFIYDFSSPEEFFIILPTGQSGNSLSEHYKDMTNKWLNGGLIKINTSETSYRNSNYSLMILE